MEDSWELVTVPTEIQHSSLGSKMTDGADALESGKGAEAMKAMSKVELKLERFRILNVHLFTCVSAKVLRRFAVASG